MVIIEAGRQVKHILNNSRLLGNPDRDTSDQVNRFSPSEAKEGQYVHHVMTGAGR